MNDLVLEIMKIALEKNTRYRNTIFINYSGHIDLIEIEVFKKGWRVGENADKHVEIRLNRNEENKLEEILNYLKGLED